MDCYFSADVETDGPIPGPFSILSFALVYVGRFDGAVFKKSQNLDVTFYRELKPISDQFEAEALRVNGLDRDLLVKVGAPPEIAMTEAAHWIETIAGEDRPVLLAYPLSFDWSWLYWYFTRFSEIGSPFGHSRCFDIKTAIAVKDHLPIARSGLNQIPKSYRSEREHSHNALDDAIEQAEIFLKVFGSGTANGGNPK